MCIACHETLNTERKDAFAEKLVGIMNQGALGLMISIGHRTGLFDVLSDGEAVTSVELAGKAGLSERYVREWLGAMTVGRVVDYDAATGRYRLPSEHAHWLCRKSPRDNMAVLAQFIAVLGNVEDKIVERFRHGGGVPYSEYGRFQEVMAEASGQTIVSVITEQVVPLVEGLHEKLVAGIDVLDVGCGYGRALNRLARAYPNSRFKGYDLSEEAVGVARAEAERLGNRNSRFEVRDLTEWKEAAAFDWILALDAIHDQARPDKVLAGIATALRPDGVFLMQDIDAASNVEDNLEHPLGPLLYSVSCMHCMTVSLAMDGLGLGTMWGRELAGTMLREAGFRLVDIHKLEHDLENAYYVVRK